MKMVSIKFRSSFTVRKGTTCWRALD